MAILFKPIILVCNTCGLWIHAAFEPSPDGKSGGILMPVMCDAHPLHVEPGELAHPQGCKTGAPVLEDPARAVFELKLERLELRKCETAPPLADVSQGVLVNSPPVVTCKDCRARSGGKLDQVTDEGDHG